MKRVSVQRSILFFGGMAACGVLAATFAVAQASRTTTAGNTVPVLMLSDIHFDPFHDPGKTTRLLAAPVGEWGKILAQPASADQASSFATLQQRCGARGVDTPYALLQSSLQSAQKAAPNAAFATVSGDLIAHAFACRFAAIFPGKMEGDYTAFVEKTVEYVTTELRDAFPRVPIYVALGNNDSNCGDNRVDGGSGFLAAVAKSVVAGFPGAMDPADRKKALADLTAGGYYSVMMPAPMRNTRLIVLDDVFMSAVYATCGGKPDTTAAAAQIAWLRKELDGARVHKERVWIMGHIPPGVDIYQTFSKIRNLCGGDAPVMFLSADTLGKVLTENSDVVRLGIFAHTHMDEWRLLEPEAGAKGGPVAIKMVASISPVNGNHPSFTVAQVNTASATLRDYTVFAASNLTSNATWSKEYEYADKYGVTAFSPGALKKLVEDFEGDPNATTQASQIYIGNFFAGDSSSLIKPLWPQYVCGLGNYTARGFVGCMCPAAH